MEYQYIQIPEHGSPIEQNSDGSLLVPEHPIIPFIEGDGVGVDITPVMKAVVDAAVAKAYGNERSLVWMEVYNGEKAAELYDGDWFPQETLDALRQYIVAIKGPLTTAIGGGFRSLNIALRQEMDLYANVRPIKWLPGTPAPVTAPEAVDIVVFRENSEDIYAGIEWKADSPGANRVIEFLQTEMGVNKIRFPHDCAIAIKPVSREATERLVKLAIQYAIDHRRSSVTLAHKGNVLKFTEGAFKQWGYQVAIEQFGATPVDGSSSYRVTNPNTGEDIIIKDVITDTLLQQLLLRPEQYDVIATLNQSGDYLSDALAAQVGSVNMIPSANISNDMALFEPTHGTADRMAGQDSINPTSILLCAEMLLRYIGWKEAADILITALEKTLTAKTVTADLSRKIADSETLSCSEFGSAVISNIENQD